MKNKKPKNTYRVHNWHDYNTALIKRGEFDLCIDQATLKQWHAKPTGKPGRPRTYSDEAIQSIILLKIVLGLPYRAVTGLVASIFRIAGMALPVPNYTSLSRRLISLHVDLPRLSSPSEPLVIAIDSTGFKIYGEGEWKVRQHGVGKRRTWIKCHVAIDVDTLEIIAVEATPSSVQDCEVVDELLAQIPEPLKAAAFDGAYDTAATFSGLEERECRPLIPPRENAVRWLEEFQGVPNPGAALRNKILDAIDELGLEGWKEECGYHCRSLVENTMYRLKQLFGGRLFSRRKEGDTQYNEVRLRAYALNAMTRLGMPQSVPLQAQAA